MDSSTFLYLGAAGWTHPAWARDFYPEGLPEDWMLSYYNTQFQAVFLPAGMGGAGSPNTWERWLHDTQESFVFIVENDSGAVLPTSARVWAASRDWQAAHIWWLDETPDLRALSGRVMQHVASGEPLFVISRRGDLGLLRRAAELRRIMGY